MTPKPANYNSKNFKICSIFCSNSQWLITPYTLSGQKYLKYSFFCNIYISTTIYEHRIRFILIFLSLIMYLLISACLDYIILKIRANSFRKMPMTCEIPNSTRSEANELYKVGHGVAQISRILNVNYSTLQLIIRKWKRVGSTENLKRAGRPKWWQKEVAGFWSQP